jgi:hypothetical protein
VREGIPITPQSGWLTIPRLTSWVCGTNLANPTKAELDITFLWPPAHAPRRWQVRRTLCFRGRCHVVVKS